jgi:hypothetical protein
MLFCKTTEGIAPMGRSYRNDTPRYTGLPPCRGTSLAKPNYSFEKRQREIAKKKQQEEKDARKREAREAAKQTPQSDQKPPAGDA